MIRGFLSAVTPPDYDNSLVEIPQLEHFDVNRTVQYINTLLPHGQYADFGLLTDTGVRGGTLTIHLGFPQESANAYTLDFNSVDNNIVRCKRSLKRGSAFGLTIPELKADLSPIISE